MGLFAKQGKDKSVVCFQKPSVETDGKLRILKGKNFLIRKV